MSSSKKLTVNFHKSTFLFDEDTVLKSPIIDRFWSSETFRQMMEEVWVRFSTPQEWIMDDITERYTKISSSKKITLMSNDGRSFEVDESVALECEVVKNVIEDVGPLEKIPLMNVNGEILAKVIEYSKKHVDLKAWDAELVKVDEATLLDLIQAADYLNYKSLLDLTLQAALHVIKGKALEIRKNDFTPEG